MKTKITTAAIVVLLFLTVVNVTALITIVYERAQAGKQSTPRESPGLRMSHIQENLNLSEEQNKLFNAQNEKLFAELEPMLKQLKEKRQSLMDEITAEKPDLEKIEKTIEEMSAVEIALKKKTTWNLLEKKNILTPEQQEKFFSLFREGCGKGMMQSRGSGLMGGGSRRHGRQEGESTHELK